MYAFLRGVVRAKHDDHIELDVRGVGYIVEMTARAWLCLPVDEGKEVEIVTECIIREDSFQIFGFLSYEDRAFFRMLLRVNGVGPKMAVAVVSEITPHEFHVAGRTMDITALTRVPGIGKRIAERIIGSRSWSEPERW